MNLNSYKHELHLQWYGPTATDLYICTRVAIIVKDRALPVGMVVGVLNRVAPHPFCGRPDKIIRMCTYFDRRVFMRPALLCSALPSTLCGISVFGNISYIPQEYITYIILYYIICIVNVHVRI